LQRVERSLSSLVACYALLASLAALLLIYVRVELQASPPNWTTPIGGLVHGSASIRALSVEQILAGTRTALLALRDRMHTTWLFFGVFAAVLLACLLWMEIERRRRRISFSRHEAYWMIAFTIAVSAIAVLYGLGTNGILARRFPGVIPVSDFVAVAFVLALPLAVWFRLDRLQEEQEDAELESESYISDRRGFLGLSNDITDARLVESLSKLEVKPVDLLPAAQAFHPEVPSEEAKAAASHLIRSAQAPASQALVPAAPPAEIGPPQVSALAPVSDLTVGPALTGIDGFRKHLAVMTGSWQRIETVRGEIDDWFERRRQEAIAHLDMHPGIRPAALEKGLFENFPGEKLAAVDAEWAEIRKAVFEINRWFEQIPVPDKSK